MTRLGQVARWSSVLLLPLSFWFSAPLQAKTSSSETSPWTSTFIVEAATLWDNHKLLIAGTMAVFLLQGCTIAGLLINRRRKLAAEQLLLESQDGEARFRFITDSSPALISVTDTRKRCIWFNSTWLAFTGRKMEQEVGDGWTQSIHPDDAKARLEAYSSHFDARKPFAIEYRLRRHDGEYRWMLDIGDPQFDAAGEFKGYVGNCLDITERKQIELEKELYQTFFMLSHDMMAITGSDGYFKKVNPACAKVLGYSVEELMAKPFFEFIVPEDRQASIAEMERQLQGELTLNFENRYRCKDGSIRVLSWHAIADHEHNVQYSTARDFTELRAAEEQLTKLWLAVEQTSHSIIVTDIDGRIEYVNRAFSDISGYSSEEVLGMNPRLLHSGQTPAAAFTDMWTALRRGEIWQGEFSNRRKNGEIYIESARISPVRRSDGEITHYLAIKEDITEQRRLFDVLRESKMLLQEVIDSTPDWIFVKDRDHRFMLANEPFAKAFHQTPQSMVGHYDTEFLPRSLIDGNPAANVPGLHDYDDAVFRGEPVHLACEKISFDSGEVRIFETFKTPLRDSSEKIYGNLCYQRDITERFNREQEQKDLETQLRQAKKMELIGHLTGGIAHDFNNILASMFGYAELIQMSPAIKQNQQLSQYLDEILQAGIRAKELVAQLMTFSQRRDAATEGVAIMPIVKEVAHLLRSVIPASIAIETTIGGGLPEVVISPVQLHQVLMNLGVNARDSIAGAGTIAISTSLVVLDHFSVCAACQLKFSGSYLMISVRDNGCGIPAENLTRIFDPFFTTKAVGHGTGLGLSVLHGIVHSANGHIEVQSELGKGTEFRVYLPARSRETRHRAEQKAPAAAVSRIAGHVMVVDDEASIVGFLTTLLENLGCRVTGLTSATEALRRFEENPYTIDLVITDQSMPDMTGVELSRNMLARRPGIPIILSTGYSAAVDEDTAREIGIRRFLFKPVPAKILADIVATYLPIRRDKPPGS